MATSGSSNRLQAAINNFLAMDVTKTLGHYNDFLAQLDKIKLPITKFNVLLKLLKKDISAYGKMNKVKALEFDERLKRVVDTYNSRDKLVFTSEVVAGFVNDLSDQLLKIFKDLQDDKTFFKNSALYTKKRLFTTFLLKFVMIMDFRMQMKSVLFWQRRLKSL